MLARHRLGFRVPPALSWHTIDRGAAPLREHAAPPCRRCGTCSSSRCCSPAQAQQPAQQPAHSRCGTDRTGQGPQRCQRLCALCAEPEPLTGLGKPLNRGCLHALLLACAAVIAAAEDDVDRTDFSDPALQSDLDKPKTLLPHEDVEPSSMIVQPIGESELRP